MVLILQIFLHLNKPLFRDDGDEMAEEVCSGLAVQLELPELKALDRPDGWLMDATAGV